MSGTLDLENLTAARRSCTLLSTKFADGLFLLTTLATVDRHASVRAYCLLYTFVDRKLEVGTSHQTDARFVCASYTVHGVK